MSKTLTGRHVLVWLVGSFAAVLAVNVLFIVKAIGTYPGEDVNNPYLQGIDYNHTLANRAQQTALGWRATIAAARDSHATVTVSVTLQSGKALPPAFALTGRLRHPMDAERDRALAFRRTGRDSFESRLVAVPRGAWDVVVNASGPMPFEASRRVWLP
jgi:nitrogen fixation protein FixH